MIVMRTEAYPPIPLKKGFLNKIYTLLTGQGYRTYSAYAAETGTRRMVRSPNSTSARGAQDNDDDLTQANIGTSRRAVPFWEEFDTRG